MSVRTLNLCRVKRDLRRLHPRGRGAPSKHTPPSAAGRVDMANPTTRKSVTVDPEFPNLGRVVEDAKQYFGYDRLPNLTVPERYPLYDPPDFSATKESAQINCCKPESIVAERNIEGLGGSKKSKCVSPVANIVVTGGLILFLFGQSLFTDDGIAHAERDQMVDIDATSRDEAAGQLANAAKASLARSETNSEQESAATPVRAAERRDSGDAVETVASMGTSSVDAARRHHTGTTSSSDPRVEASNESARGASVPPPDRLQLMPPPPIARELAPDVSERSGFSVQLASFQNKSTAEAAVERLTSEDSGLASSKGVGRSTEGGGRGVHDVLEDDDVSAAEIRSAEISTLDRVGPAGDSSATQLLANQPQLNETERYILQDLAGTGG